MLAAFCFTSLDSAISTGNTGIDAVRLAEPRASKPMVEDTRVKKLLEGLPIQGKKSRLV